MQLFGQDYWGGVCGFVSVIHGILLSKDDGNALDGLDQDELEYNVGMSVLSFIKHLNLNDRGVADDLVKFTQAFGGIHKNKTIEQLIMECDKALAAIKVNSGKRAASEASWGVAMSKRALLAYIDWVGAKASEVPHNGVWTQQNLGTFKNCVCGVGNLAEQTNGFLGLRHWVYVNEAGVLYNWGKQTKLDTSTQRPYVKTEHNYLVHVLKLS